MSSSNLVSILIPAYNEEKYLDDCLSSIHKQSYKNWEAIVVNDFSIDHTKQIIDSWRAKDSRIVGLENNTKGIIPALSLAYNKANGKYITRMDADDIMPINKLEVLMSLYSKNPGAVVTGKVKYFNAFGEGFIQYQNWLNHLMENNCHYSEIYRECVLPSAAWLTTKDVIDKIGGITTNTYPEDYDLVFRMYKMKVPIVASSKVVHQWRDHEERASRNDPNYSDFTFLELKLNNFLSIDFDNEQPLVLWGAGQKGKRLAKMLLNRSIPFKWVCNNENKINKEIYGKALESSTNIPNTPNSTQIIFTVANPHEQKLIKEAINKNRVIRSYWFC